MLRKLDLPADIIYSQSVRANADGSYSIVKCLPIDEFPSPRSTLPAPSSSRSALKCRASKDTAHTTTYPSMVFHGVFFHLFAIRFARFDYHCAIEHAFQIQHINRKQNKK